MYLTHSHSTTDMYSLRTIENVLLLPPGASKETFEVNETFGVPHINGMKETLGVPHETLLDME